MLKKIRAFFEKRAILKDREYSKRLLNRIVNNSLLMMWASYALAFVGMPEIAETLSSTIASAIIAVVVGYLVKSTVENISKYTTAFGEHIKPDNSGSDDHNTRAE